MVSVFGRILLTLRETPGIGLPFNWTLLPLTMGSFVMAAVKGIMETEMLVPATRVPAPDTINVISPMVSVTPVARNGMGVLEGCTSTACARAALARPKHRTAAI